MDCAIGFRACGTIHQTWFNFIKDVINQFNTLHPQQLDLIGIGINTQDIHRPSDIHRPHRHAMADRDALAALGELLAFEVHHGLRLLEHIRSAEKEWVNVKMLLPGYAGEREKLKQNK